MRPSTAAAPRPSAGAGADGAAPTSSAHSDAKGIGVVVVAITVMSLNSSMIKGAHVPGAVAGFWRLTIAALLWHAILLARRRPVPRAAWRAALAPGLCFGLNITMFFNGVTHTRIANAEFIGTLSPLLVVPFAAWRLGESVRRRTVLLGFTALVGVSLVVLFSGKGGEHSWVGDAFAFGGVVTWTTYLLLGRRARQGLDTGPFMACVSTIAALVLLPTALATGHITDVSGHAWLILLGLGVNAGVVGHGLLAWAQRHAQVSTISLLQLAQPAMSATWAFVLLGESVRAVQVVGMALMLVSVAGIVRGAVQAATARAPRPAVRPAAEADPAPALT